MSSNSSMLNSPISIANDGLIGGMGVEPGVGGTGEKVSVGMGALEGDAAVMAGAQDAAINATSKTIRMLLIFMDHLVLQRAAHRFVVRILIGSILILKIYFLLCKVK